MLFGYLKHASLISFIVNHVLSEFLKQSVLIILLCMKCIHMYVGLYPMAQTYRSEDNFIWFPPSAVRSNSAVELNYQGMAGTFTG